MNLREFARLVLGLAQEGLVVNEGHGHSERLAQTIGALEAIEKLAGEHAQEEQAETASAEAPKTEQRGG